MRDCENCKHRVMKVEVGKGTPPDHFWGCECWECEFEPTKNDLAVDCISRADAIKAMQNKAKKLKNEDTINGLCGAVAILYEMPSVTPQEPRCKDCKWWKDSDGKYRRGCGAESQCPINTHAVYYGEGYCYMFSPKAESEVEE